MLTHRNIVANTMMIKAAEAGMLQPTGGPDGKGDKLLAFLPFFHIYGETPPRGTQETLMLMFSRPHMFDPPKYVLWLATSGHAKVRS
jgi:acyl-CoA synthetase (AMP-forming)/AMP-acid ligase II